MLTNMVKNDTFVAEARHNPWESFYSNYRCYDKGREGSETYDSAGFQFDYDKVCEWMKPEADNKQKMIRNMDRAVDKAQSEEEQMFDLFFVNAEKAKKGVSAKNYVCDQVNKDLGIPWRQIGPEQVQLWRDRGFEPVSFEKWWKERKVRG